jgi:iron complex transport system permease protein
LKNRISALRAKKRNSLSPYWVNLALLVLALLLNVAVGAVFIPPSAQLRIFASKLPSSTITADWPIYFETIMMSIRLPHAILAMFTGAALASSGAAYQGLFRNPLADPYLIGVASGAGLGAVFALVVKWPQDLLGLFVVPAAAFLGALITILLVYSLARVGQVVPLTTLLLAGVAVGAFASALTSFLMLRAEEQVHRAISFLLGGSPMSGWQPVLAALPYLLFGLGLLSLSGHALNLLQFGEEQAKQLGLPVELAKTFVIVVSSLTTAVAVSFSGVIGFIGLIVPHVLRMIWGADYRRLIPLSIIAGGSSLLLADMLSRWLFAPRVLPVGIVTALAGTPFFLWILRKAKTEVFW